IKALALLGWRVVLAAGAGGAHPLGGDRFQECSKASAPASAASIKPAVASSSLYLPKFRFSPRATCANRMCSRLGPSTASRNAPVNSSSVPKPTIHPGQLWSPAMIVLVSAGFSSSFMADLKPRLGRQVAESVDETI